MNFENQEEWITAKEAAERKGIHRNNIARAIREGRLKGVMVGGRYLMRRADVEQWEPVGHRPRKDEQGRKGSVRELPTLPDRSQMGKNETMKQQTGALPRVDPDETSFADQRRELIAYLESGETDREARARLEAMPGGAAMLARALAMKATLAPFAGTEPSVEQYLQWKREEREAEQQRDERRYAEHA